ncbi:MAG TPA: DNA alkylation repair protein [Bacteroidales bacterium]|jgi:3-methyladenine DNA glycosylase AlkD|nr:DNA alkylation repair protein [Bacteroidales bacterium]OQB64869.1 MAG: DNA alkylation repair enzyme [Bacteroidetes bacterium ADurb.Bin145]NMD02989.1 DNA alkylation repair protein [Bacteroidales bacterium]HOU02025.1 DNA alkylation repair protein [Bacteroidales bacterium]HQG64046.1 DNA alkylation repair protein [Bacteroidales bacterium]
MNGIIEKIRADLRLFADEKTRLQGERFFKEDIKLYGLKAARVTELAKTYFKLIPERSKKKVFELCEELWRSGYAEEGFIACEWSYSVRKEYVRDDFAVFGRWVHKYITNWATCDTLCNHTVGTFIEMYPEFISDLKKWAHSDNRWVKRASAVSFIVPARKGMFLNDIFEIADILHSDSDDMVRKGYGWMLKAASQAHQKEVFDYVMKRKATMPRTSLRYAIEKMPQELKKLAMAR